MAVVKSEVYAQCILTYYVSAIYPFIELCLEQSSVVTWQF